MLSKDARPKMHLSTMGEHVEIKPLHSDNEKHLGAKDALNSLIETLTAPKTEISINCVGIYAIH